MDELKKMMTNYQESFINNVKLFSNKFYPTLSDSLIVYTEMASTVKA